MTTLIILRFKRKSKRIVSVITPENKKEWIAKAIELPKAELEREVIKVNPLEARRETIRLISDDRVSLTLSLCNARWE